MTKVQPVATYPGGFSSTDWDFVVEGDFIRYYKRFGTYTATSVGAHGLNALASGLSFPNSITGDKIKYFNAVGMNDNTNSAQFYVSMWFDVGGSGSTFSLSLRNLTTSTLTFSNVYVYVELLVRR